MQSRYTLEGYDFDVEGGEITNSVVLSVLAETEREALEKAKQLGHRDYYRTDCIEEAPVLSEDKDEEAQSA